MVHSLWAWSRLGRGFLRPGSGHSTGSAALTLALFHISWCICGAARCKVIKSSKGSEKHSCNYWVIRWSKHAINHKQVLIILVCLHSPIYIVCDLVMSVGKRSWRKSAFIASRCHLVCAFPSSWSMWDRRDQSSHWGTIFLNTPYWIKIYITSRLWSNTRCSSFSGR